MAMAACKTDEEREAAAGAVDFEKRDKEVTPKTYDGEPRIIFDNGGGITLQLTDYAHHYTDVEQCADDLADWVKNEDTSEWDGNEEEAVFEPTTDQISNGGYRVETVEDFMSLPLCEVRDMSWGNIRDLYAALTKRVLG